MDLIRTILLEMEENQNPNAQIKLKAVGYSPEHVSYHVKILKQAGLVDAVDASSFGGIEWIPTSLTWQGHEFLEATRNEGVWQKLKAQLKDRGMSLPFSLIQELAIKIAAEYMGLK
jgi:DNA-binding transcriptional ArsR family regulator